MLWDELLLLAFRTGDMRELVSACLLCLPGISRMGP